jgi:carboxyl-terminal processing protease
MRLYASILIVLFVASLSPAADRISPNLAERERIARESRQALTYLQDYHYIQKPLADFSADDILREYIGELDYSRMFFTEPQIRDFVSRFDTTLQTVYLSRGDLFPAIDIYNSYYKVAQERLRWVQKRLKRDFDLTTMERYAPDRTKAEWPRNAAEADALWEKRLKNELLTELLSGRSITEARQKLLERYSRSERSLDEFDVKDVQTAFLTCVAQLYDPHSNYFSTEDLEDFSITMSNTLVGIGALLKDEDGYCVVQELISGGPAEETGLLHPGDKIVEVAQDGEKSIDVVDMKISKVVKMIRGEPGSTVSLTIVPAGAPDSKRRTIRLERNEVHLTAGLASARVIEVPEETGPSYKRTIKTIAVGVVDLPSFYGGDGVSSTSEDIKELIHKLQGMGIKALVLDLRKNGGGLLTEAINTVGLFLPPAPAVQVRDSAGNVKVDSTTEAQAAYTGPLVVLTSRESASASEIVAGALQCLDRAVIVGDKATHGKGTVQAIFEIDRGLLAEFLKQTASGAIKVTIQKFYLPNGASTQNKGVPSDIALPSIDDALPIGESDLPHALPYDTIAAARTQKTDAWDTISILDDAKRSYLKEQSQSRRQDLPEFHYLTSVVSRLTARANEKSLWLNYDLRQKEKQLDETFAVDSEKELKSLSKDRYPSADVLLDISWKMRSEHQQQLKDAKLPDGSPRLNVVVGNIFYYEPKGSMEVKEIDAQKIDFESLLAENVQLSAKLGLTPEQMKKVLEQFKQGEERSEFDVADNFKKALGSGVDAKQLEQLPVKFFQAAVELNPELADEHVAIDIPLREAERVAADWACMGNVTAPALEEGKVARHTTVK